MCSVWAAGGERKGKFFPDDMTLRKGHGFLGSISHLCYIIALYFECLADKYPGRLSLSHVYPGGVDTDAGKNGELPLWTWPLLWVASLLPLYPKVPGLEVGERNLFVASERFPPRGAVDSEEREALALPEGVTVATGSDGTVGGGAYRVSWDGETIPKLKWYDAVRKDKVKERVWEHVEEVFRTVLDEGKAYKG